MAAVKKNTRMAELEKKIREMFPTLQYLLDDPDGFFGPEIRELLFTAVRENWTETKFRSEFSSSKYYENTANKLREWDAKDPATKKREVGIKVQSLQGQYGNVFGSPENTWMIARDILRNGYSGASEAFFVNAQLKSLGRRDLLNESADARDVRNLARQYFYKVSMDELEPLLLGEVQIADFENKLKARSKVNFPHLRDAIDMGLTLEDVAKTRRKAVADTLEMDEFSIDFLNPKYMRLLDPSEKGDGPMSVAEVMRLVKTDPSYGYQYTKQANKAATSLGATVARMFGAIQ
jgi:hypothetical protein